ncbi:MAG: PIN domain-containing protein [Campylobacterota bacterium]|nr:PIN domain-containing protein [Campylobacterota bacterium]
MVYLLDANIIIRFLIGDDERFLTKSVEYFQEIEKAALQVEILEGVLMEAFFVLTKFYKLPREEVILDLKTILALDGVVNRDKIILHEALTIVEVKNIDFVDALICAKSRLQGYGKLSFDTDVKKC